MELINKLADPNVVSTLSAGEKFSGGLMVAVIGMSITFLALVFLWFAINVMSNALGVTKKEKPKAAAAAPAASAPVASAAKEDDAELVAVITAAIAASLGKSTSQLVVNKITRIPDSMPAWARKGLSDQFTQR